MAEERNMVSVADESNKVSMAEESNVVSVAEESNVVSVAEESNVVSVAEESNMVSNSQSPQTESELNNETETLLSPQTESELNNATETLMESPQMKMDSKKEVDPSGSPNGGVELTGTDVVARRKRGRPRKYEIIGDEGNTMTLVSPPPGFSSSYSERLPKKGRGRPKGSGKWQRLASQLGGFPMDPSGGRLNTQVLFARAGEDIVGKIYSVSQRTPRSLCVLTATGVVSTVFIRQPNSSGGLMSFQGRFQILTLSGSFTYGATHNAHGKNGMLSVTLSHPDGRVFGGAVAGAMTAYEPVQIIVTSFQQDPIKGTSKELKRRRSVESSSSTSMLGNSGLARVPLLMTAPKTGLDEICISPTPLMEFPANNGAGNLIASTHMNPASLAGFSPNPLQSIPGPKTSPDMDTFVPLT